MVGVPYLQKSFWKGLPHCQTLEKSDSLEDLFWATAVEEEHDNLVFVGGHNYTI